MEKEIRVILANSNSVSVHLMSESVVKDLFVDVCVREKSWRVPSESGSKKLKDCYDIGMACPAQETLRHGVIGAFNLKNLKDQNAAAEAIFEFGKLSRL